MRRAKYILAMMILFSAPTVLFSATPIYTYAGLSATGGYSINKYSDWGGSTMEDYSAAGSFCTPELMLQLYAPFLIGEFTAGYLFNFTNTPETKMSLLNFSSKIKYRYILTQTINLTVGPGMYFNTPPSTKQYDATGGGLICAGAAFDIGFDWKVSTDVFCSYGQYGVGHDGTRLGFGGSIGVLRKFGKF